MGSPRFSRAYEPPYPVETEELFDADICQGFRRQDYRALAPLETDAGRRCGFALHERGPGCQFRVEVNQQYRSRWFELLMVHQADNGELPPDNARNPPPNLGRLSPS